LNEKVFIIISLIQNCGAMVFVDPLTIMLVAVAASTYLIALYLYRVAKGEGILMI